MDHKKTDVIKNLHNLAFYRKQRLWKTVMVPITPAICKEDHTDNAANEHQLHSTESNDEDNARAGHSNIVEVSHPNRTKTPDNSMDGQVNARRNLSISQRLEEAVRISKEERNRNAIIDNQKEVQDMSETVPSEEEDSEYYSEDESILSQMDMQSQEDIPRNSCWFLADDASHANEELGQSLAAALPPRHEPSGESYELEPSGNQYEYNSLENMYENGPVSNKYDYYGSENVYEGGPSRTNYVNHNLGNMYANEYLEKKDEPMVLYKKTHERYVMMYKTVCDQYNLNTSFIPSCDEEEDSDDEYADFMRSAHGCPHSSFNELDQFSAIFTAENLSNHTLAAMSPQQLDYNLFLVSDVWRKIMNEKFKRREINKSASSESQAQDQPANEASRRLRGNRNSGQPRVNNSV